MFPSTALGVTSAPLAVTLTNTGGSAFQVKSIANDPQFRITGGTCLTSPRVAAGASCDLNVTFTPSVRGPATGSLTVLTDVLDPVLIAATGTSPTTTTLSLGGKNFVLNLPTPILGLPDTDPATLPTDVTASLWNMAAGVSAFADGTGSPALLASGQQLASVQWPIRFAYWQVRGTTSGGAGCQVDLVGSNLVLSANGIATSAPVDGSPPALNNRGDVIFVGDVLRYWAGERTIGVVSVVRSVQIDAFDGTLLGNNNSITLVASYDSHGAGAYGTATATRQTATTAVQYVCSDTP